MPGLSFIFSPFPFLGPIPASVSAPPPTFPPPFPPCLGRSHTCCVFFLIADFVHRTQPNRVQAMGGGGLLFIWCIHTNLSSSPSWLTTHTSVINSYLEIPNALASHCHTGIRENLRNTNYKLVLWTTQKPCPEALFSEIWKKGSSLCHMGLNSPWRPCYAATCAALSISIGLITLLINI